MTPQQAYTKSSFGPSFLFLSRRKRAALAHYYTFCRLADDIADEPNEQPQRALQLLAQEVAYIYLGAPKTDWGKALVDDVRKFNLPKDRFTLLIEGMQADLDQKCYASFEELAWYLYRVAVIVGKATLDILGVHGEKADELAQTLGSAVQLTNIVRDVREDAKLGRVYLPCALTAQDILTGQNQELVTQLCQQAAQRAHENYRRAFNLMDEFWPTVMLPCRVMGYVYQKNLAKIERAGFISQESLKLTKFEKLQMVGYALLKTLF